jgi:hypothetical protein
MLAQRQKLRFSGGSLQLTVPQQALRDCGLVKGDSLDVVYDPTTKRLIVDLGSAHKSKIIDTAAVAELAA